MPADQDCLDSAYASEAFIDFKLNGAVEAGLVMENGRILTVRLDPGQEFAESSEERFFGERSSPHSVSLRRLSCGNVVRETRYFNIPSTPETYSPKTRPGRYWMAGNA